MMKTATPREGAKKIKEKHIENEDKLITFGKHKDISFKDLFEKHGDYARWFYSVTREPSIDGKTPIQVATDLI
jgi:hypothetical protein